MKQLQFTSGSLNIVYIQTIYLQFNLMFHNISSFFLRYVFVFLALFYVVLVLWFSYTFAEKIFVLWCAVFLFIECFLLLRMMVKYDEC